MEVRDRADNGGVRGQKHVQPRRASRIRRRPARHAARGTSAWPAVHTTRTSMRPRSGPTCWPSLSDSCLCSSLAGRRGLMASAPTCRRRCSAARSKPSARGCLIKAEIAVDAVRDHALAGLRPHALAVEAYLDLVCLKRDEARHGSDLGPGIPVGPGRVVRVPDVVVAARSPCRGRRSGTPRR
jgi:hypothetical protein